MENDQVVQKPDALSLILWDRQQHIQLDNTSTQFISSTSLSLWHSGLNTSIGHSACWLLPAWAQIQVWKGVFPAQLG